MQKVDLVVVGGSFAGLTCVQAAAARAVKTVVLERKPDVGAMPQTTGILVKEVADAWDIPRRLTRTIRGVRLYSPNLKSVDLISPGYYFLATDAPALLRWMANQASDAGAEVRCRAAYSGSISDHDLIYLDGHNLQCRYLVGCDGARSRVASDYRLGRNELFLTGIEAEYEGVSDVDEDCLHVFLNSDLARGYIAWVIPGCGITQVGLAVRKPRVPRLNEFFTQIRRVFNFDRAKRVAMRGGLIPCGGTVRPFAARGVMLLGDAAGTVSPLTAGGIHTAMYLGRAAGVAISDHLLYDGRDPSRVISGLLPSFFFKRLLRLGMDFGPPNWLYDQLLGSQTFRAIAQAVFFHHRGLFSLEAWREIVLSGR